MQRAVCSPAAMRGATCMRLLLFLAACSDVSDSYSDDRAPADTSDVMPMQEVVGWRVISHLKERVASRCGSVYQVLAPSLWCEEFAVAPKL